MSGGLRMSRIQLWLMGLGGSLALLVSLSAVAAVPVQPPQSSAGPAALPAVDPTPQQPGDPLSLDWETLLPADERGGSSAGPPPAIHDYLGEDAPGALQLGSPEVNPALNSMRVKVPGYVDYRALRTRMKNSQLGTAAYTLEATKVEKYDFEPR